ncbi:MAG: ATP-dependent DNA helicase RecG, partial [Alphaproteobacteria bacterium]|nr:ATP-dependent DNA helicase RecG [Alphaproteobacteria bacterium]
AISRYESLRGVFGDRVALIHGKMKSDEKDAVMKDFANPNGKTKILVATTVIEVGVNVPEATLMVIEHSERFGLSSLHQLRGRIGRGADKSICILLHSPRMTAVARERLSIMKETTDGFKIAEKDLKLRGAGDVLGVRQSGIIDFRIANLEDDYDLFLAASQDVKNILSFDKKNDTERWKSLQFLLQLFEYTKQIKNLNG